MKNREHPCRCIAQRAFTSIEGNIISPFAGGGQTPCPHTNHATLKGEAHKRRIFGGFRKGQYDPSFQGSEFGVHFFHLTKEITDAVAIVKATVQDWAATRHE